MSDDIGETLDETRIAVDSAAPARRSPVAESLRIQALRGAAWTLGGQAGGQGMRFLVNVILTRLLWPEAFGVMKMIEVVQYGLQMFSDLGVGASIIQNKRGEDPVFLRTAWTVQIVRGTCLWIAALILTLPVAAYYTEPDLKLFLPIVALTAVIDGFNSVAIHVMNRRLKIGLITRVDLVTQAIGAATMIAWAYFWPSIWALVAGAIMGSVSKMTLSHIWFREPRMRPAFDREAMRSLFGFGRWIFIATALTFFTNRADQLVLGKFLTTAEFGVYALAVQISGVIPAIIGRLSQRVLFPVYARSVEGGLGKLRNHTMRIRAALLLFTLPPLWLFAIFGQEIVDFVYTPPYHDAGWMLQILAVGAMFTVIVNPVAASLIAVGDSFRHMILQIGKSTVYVGSMLAGGYLGGPDTNLLGFAITRPVGVMLGFAISGLLYYPLLVVLIRRYRTWLPALDLAAVVASLGVVGLGLWLKS